MQSEAGARWCQCCCPHGVLHDCGNWLIPGPLPGNSTEREREGQELHKPGALWDEIHVIPKPPSPCPAPAVMRCLGVPSRVVTNYNSAHDTNGNLVIDRYLNETGEEDRRSRDMIWWVRPCPLPRQCLPLPWSPVGDGGG